MTDSGFTGILPADLGELKDALPNKVPDLEKIISIRRNPYIGDLGALYSLEQAMSQVQITDVGVLYGIADLRSLSTLILPKCALTDVSLNALGDVPRLLVLEMFKNPGVSPEAITALKAKKKDMAFNLYSDLTARLFA